MNDFSCCLLFGEVKMGILPQSSYYTRDQQQTAALIRARRPFLVKNIFTGIGISAFAIGVCEFQFIPGHNQLGWPMLTSKDAFTIHAVAQDDFSDVQIPDAPEQPPHTPHTGVLKTPPEVADMRK
ncbi:MAG: hypothetical protein Q9181_004725 [Wetmoreana brouardii]